MPTRIACCLLASLLLSEFPALAGAPATTQPAAPTTQPQARWHYWPAGWAAWLIAANKQSLWFSLGDGLVRHDVAARTARVFGHLDGLPFGPLRDLELADDGRAVFVGGLRGGYLWDPKRGWSFVPDPGGPIRSEPGYSAHRQILFNPDGTMLGSFGRELFRWTESGWQGMGELPRRSRLAVSAEGFYLSDAYSTPGGLGRDVFMAKDRADPRLAELLDLKDPTPLKLEGDWSYDQRYYTVRGELFALLSRQVTGRPGLTIERGLFRIGPEGFETIGIGDTFGLDLRGGGTLQLKPIQQRADATRYAVVAADGPAGEVTVPHDQRTTYKTLPMPLRDAGGRLWLGGRFWDGKCWTELQAGGCPSGLLHGWDAMDPARFSLEAGPGGSLAWRNLFPDVPPTASGFDPKDRTGWLFVEQGQKRELQFIRFVADGPQAVLRSVPAGRFNYSPTHRTPDGEWWWLDFREPAADSLQVWRLLPDGELKMYSSGHSLPLSARGRPAKSVPELFLSPAGHLWLWHADNYFARYDATADKLVRAQPWDEFAFQFAGRTLSMVPSSNQYSIRPPRLIGVVYEKRDDVWQPLPGPDDSPLYARPGFTHGHRMLVYSSTGSGLFEYDATYDKWLLLYRRYAFIAASFDPAGRRLLAGSSFVLALDGDPFAIDIGAVVAARNAAANPDDLLRRLDDRDFAVRERASAELKKIAPTMVDWMRMIAADPDQPPEVRARVREALSGLPPPPASSKPEPPPSLYDLMHPVLGQTPRASP